VTGTSGSHMTGVIYFPADPIQYNGDVTGFNGCTQVVADQITWIGNATLNVDCSTYGINQVQIGGAVHLIG
jgi:hypothetical protein